MSLRVQHVSVSLDGRGVLNDIDFEVATGRILAVRGRSGIGKSTLLRVIAGLIRPDTGRIIVDHIDVTDVPTHRRSIGLVFQDSQLFPHLDVAGNIAFGLRMKGFDRPTIDHRVVEWLDRIGLADRASQNVATLSGGEARRVALARALAAEPKLVLLDEPFTGVDTELRESLIELVRELLARTGTTAILVSHDDDDVARIAHDEYRLAEPN